MAIKYGQPKMNATHKRFIFNQVVAGIESCTKIVRMLADPELGAEYGYKPIQITHQRISAYVRRQLQKDEVLEARRKYYANFLGCPLAQKRWRLDELLKLYDRVETLDRPDSEKIRMKQNILKQAKDEIGEDIEKLAEAIRGSGDQHYHYDFGSMPDDERDRIKGNIRRAFGFDGNGNGSGSRF